MTQDYRGGTFYLTDSKKPVFLVVSKGALFSLFDFKTNTVLPTSYCMEQMLNYSYKFILPTPVIEDKEYQELLV